MPDARARQRGDAAMAAFLSSESGPCIWLHTRPGVASQASRETAVNEYYCEQLRAERADHAQAERRARQAAACLALARALETGDEELQADPARAQAAYTLACQNGQAEACARLRSRG
jgi:TPR repeat protein